MSDLFGLFVNWPSDPDKVRLSLSARAGSLAPLVREANNKPAAGREGRLAVILKLPPGYD